MGRTTVKPETIEEGFRLCIGGKEIEVNSIIFITPNNIVNNN